MNNKITQNISLAVTALQNGSLVAFPTETVYGLGADARNETAILKVFAAKGRPSDHPLIVHIGSIQEISNWARQVPDAAFKLAEAFWPGPLTLILPKQAHVSPLITGGQDSVALRMPAHPITEQLLHEFGSALVGPSANKYGHVSPTTAQHVIDDLDAAVTLVLDGGACKVGIESTIVSLLNDRPQILRAGAISSQQIAQVLQQAVMTHANESTVRTSGSHASHYAPGTPTYLLAMQELIEKAQEYQQCAVMSLHVRPTNIPEDIIWHTMSNDPKLYAQDLYAVLRSLDQLKTKAILVEDVPSEWTAIKDRLSRASFKSDFKK